MSRHHAQQIRQAERGPDALCAVLIEKAHEIQGIVLDLRHVATRLSADPRVWSIGGSLSNAALVLSDVAADVAMNRSKLRATEQSAPITDTLLFDLDQTDEIQEQSLRDAKTNTDVTDYNADAPRREREHRAAAETQAVEQTIAAVMSDAPMIPTEPQTITTAPPIIPTTAPTIPEPVETTQKSAPIIPTEIPEPEQSIRAATRSELSEHLQSLMDDPNVNDYGVFKKYQTIDIPLPANTACQAAIHVAQANNGQWLGAYKLQMPLAKGGWFTSLPNVGTEAYSTRAVAVIAQRDEIADRLQKCGHRKAFDAIMTYRIPEIMEGDPRPSLCAQATEGEKLPKTEDDEPLSYLGIEQALATHLTLNGISNIRELADAIKRAPDLWTFHQDIGITWNQAHILTDALKSHGIPGIAFAPANPPQPESTPATDRLVALATGAATSKAQEPEAKAETETTQKPKRTRRPKEPESAKTQPFDALTAAEEQVAEWLRMIAKRIGTHDQVKNYVRLLGMSLMTLQNTAGETVADTHGLNTYLISLHGHPCYAIPSHDFSTASKLAHALNPYTTHEVTTKAVLTGQPDHVALLSPKTLGRLDRISERVRAEAQS